MHNGYCVAEHIKPETAGRLARHPIIHLQFNDRAFDLYAAVFGDVPAPWPLLPIELENLETELEFKARRIDLRLKGFSDWAHGIMLEHLKKSLSHGWPLDWHFIETVLIPAKSAHEDVVEILKAIIDTGGGISNQSLELGVVVAQDLGWCGLRSPVQEFNWLVIFQRDKRDSVSAFVNSATALGAQARLVKVGNSELYI